MIGRKKQKASQFKENIDERIQNSSALVEVKPDERYMHKSLAEPITNLPNGLQCLRFRIYFLENDFI